LYSHWVVNRFTLLDMSAFDPSKPFPSYMLNGLSPDSPKSLPMPGDSEITEEIPDDQELQDGPDRVAIYDTDHQELFDVSEADVSSECEPTPEDSPLSPNKNTEQIIPPAVPLPIPQQHEPLDASPKWQQYTAQAISDGKLLDIPVTPPNSAHPDQEEIFNLDDINTDVIDPSDSAYISRAIDQIRPVTPEKGTIKKEPVFVPIIKDKSQSAFVRRRGRRFHVPILEEDETKEEAKSEPSTTGQDKAVNFFDESLKVPTNHISEALRNRRQKAEEKKAEQKAEEKKTEEKTQTERPLRPDKPGTASKYLDAVEHLAEERNKRREKRRQRNKRPSGDRDDSIESGIEPPFLGDRGHRGDEFQSDYDVTGITSSRAVVPYQRPGSPDWRGELMGLGTKNVTSFVDDEKKKEEDLPEVEIATGQKVKVHMDIYTQFPHQRMKWEEIMLLRFHKYPGMSWEEIIEIEAQPIEVVVYGKNVKVDDDIVEKFRDLPGKMTQMMMYRKIYPGFDLDFILKLEKEQSIILNSFKKIKIHADVLKKHLNDPIAWKEIMEIREYQWPGKTWEQIQELEKESENERQLKMFQMQQEMELAREQRQKERSRQTRVKVV
jgi:hypothetical protein